jgi:hypothetical protein
MTDTRIARIPLRCQCGRLAAYMVIEDGKPSIEVLNRHDGSKHTTRIPWDLSITTPVDGLYRKGIAQGNT